MDRNGEPDIDGIALDFREMLQERKSPAEMFPLSMFYCSNCGKEIKWVERNWSQDNLGKVLCRPCQRDYRNIQNNYDTP